MTNEEKILTLLESMQKDMAELKAEIQDLKVSNNETELKKKLVASQLEALENFRRADTPEEKAEIEAFKKFMDAEELRKTTFYKLVDNESQRENNYAV